MPLSPAKPGNGPGCEDATADSQLKKKCWPAGDRALDKHQVKNSRTQQMQESLSQSGQDGQGLLPPASRRLSLVWKALNIINGREPLQGESGAASEKTRPHISSGLPDACAGGESCQSWRQGQEIQRSGPRHEASPRTDGLTTNGGCSVRRTPRRSSCCMNRRLEGGCCFRVREGGRGEGREFGGSLLPSGLHLWSPYVLRRGVTPLSPAKEIPHKLHICTANITMTKHAISKGWPHS